MLVEDLILLKEQGNLHVSRKDRLLVKEKKRRRESGQDLYLREGAVKKEYSPYLRKSSHW